MRIILFRGKSVETDEWVFGDFFGGADGDYILQMDDKIKVKDNTISQFTGLFDKNYNKIFEGDILRYTHWENNEDILYHIIFEDEMGGFVLQKTILKHQCHITQKAIYAQQLEIIGNIYDDAYLLVE